MVVNGVSRNGNFDINVGPTAEGVISDVEREPLIALGRWLEVNGEAVYGTRPWRITSSCHPRESGDIRFTAKGDYVYAISLKWQGVSFRIASVQPVKGSPVIMLGVDKPLAWRRDGDGIVIDYPLHRSRPAQCSYAWVFNIRVKGN